MKQYKALVQKGDTDLILPISDGQSFIFSIPAPAYKKARNVSFNLHFNNLPAYKSSWDPKNTKDIPGITQDDKNFVFRLDKIHGPWFTAYINDQSCSHLSHSTVNANINIENRLDVAAVAIDSPDTVPITLTVFEYEEYGKVGAFAKAMRNLESTDLETEDEESQALERREKALSADGADGVDSSVPNTIPADANLVRYSSTVAWPIAVELVAGESVMNTVKLVHDQLMCAWVVQRGANESLKTSDYFAHSHAAAWPAAVAGYKFDKILKRVQERHERLMMLVPLGKAEGSS